MEDTGGTWRIYISSVYITQGRDVRSFLLEEIRPAAPVGTLGQVPATDGGYVIIVRDNPHHNPQRAWNSTAIMNTRFYTGTMRPRDSGEFDLTVYTERHLAGSLRVPLELSGTQLLFEVDFDAEGILTCGEYQ